MSTPWSLIIRIVKVTMVPRFAIGNAAVRSFLLLTPAGQVMHSGCEGIIMRKHWERSADTGNHVV